MQTFGKLVPSLLGFMWGCCLLVGGWACITMLTSFHSVEANQAKALKEFEREVARQTEAMDRLCRDLQRRLLDFENRYEQEADQLSVSLTGHWNDSCRNRIDGLKKRMDQVR